MSDRTPAERIAELEARLAMAHEAARFFLGLVLDGNYEHGKHVPIEIYVEHLRKAEQGLVADDVLRHFAALAELPTFASAHDERLRAEGAAEALKQIEKLLQRQKAECGQ